MNGILAESIPGAVTVAESAGLLGQQILGIVVALLFLSFILYLAGRGRFNLRYFILWLCMGILAFSLAIFPDLMFVFARLIGVAIPLNAVFFVALFLVALELVQLTVSITSLEEQNKLLCQELALLREEIRADSSE
jgi:hypothetical protein